MRTDHTVTSDRVANKDEQQLNRHETDCEQNDRSLWKHYIPLRSVTKFHVLSLDDIEQNVWKYTAMSRTVSNVFLLCLCETFFTDVHVVKFRRFTGYESVVQTPNFTEMKQHGLV